jgi:signal peptidase II
MVIWIVLACILIGIDQVSKALVVANFSYEGATIGIIPDFFHFTYVRNSGAVFGLGGNTGWLLYFFIGTAILAAFLFVFLFLKINFKRKDMRIYAFALTLLFAGTLGNCLDRIFQPDHSVVDFIDFRGIWTYVFNVADMCLCIGIGFFLFDQLILDAKRVKKNGHA